MSDTGNHNESSPIPNSVETVIPESKVVIKSYVWKMTKQCGGYKYTCTVNSEHYTKNLNMPEN